jgi:predicted metal-binding membrane protein
VSALEGVLEKILRRDRAILIAGLAALTLLAWLYVWRGAGMGMNALAMTKLALFPHLLPEPMPGMAMPPIAWLTVVAMWWVMMIAMMTPSAAPLIFLYGRIMRHAAAQDSATTLFIPTAFLVAGYLLVWLAFSAAATILQYTLQHAGFISPMMLWSQSALLSATVLILAGVYQFSSLKHACLQHCRGPVHFLTQHMCKGSLGALRMGVEHGAWCVGCCWMLMALLFVGGVMNLVWIALLAVLVLVEKLTPRGAIVGRIIGGVLIAWGVATMIVSPAT